MQPQLRDVKIRTMMALSGLLMVQACSDPTVGISSSTGESSTTGGMTTGELTSSEGSNSGDATTGEPNPGVPARVTLQVVDGDRLTIEGALVEFSGASHNTGVDGLLDLPVGVDELATRLVMRVSAGGYTTSTAVFDKVASGAELLHVVVLHALGEPVVLPAESGGVAERAGIRVELPPDAFVDAHGHPVRGNVEVTLVPLDPTLPDAMAELPGPLAAVRADESAAELEPVMMAEISAWQDGQRLQLAPGKKARLTFAVPTALQSTVSAGQSIPAWFFDHGQGLWREEGAGTIVSEDGRLAWIVEVAHFTWWNADKPWIDKNCWDVTVVNPMGNPVMNMQVTAAGLDYQGTMSKYTKADGLACVEAKRGGLVALKAGLSPNFLAEVQVQGAVEQPGACNGPGECTPVTLMLPEADCYPGEQVLCYTGPEKTAGVGACKLGAKTQLGDCSWSTCAGDVLPTDEKCAANNIDEDCNGEPDNGCLCVPGAKEACTYVGDDGIKAKQEKKIGLCVGGERECAGDGQSWGPCEGMYPSQGQPIPNEICNDSLDNDCDSQVDEECQCGQNDPPKKCYPSNPKDLENGICKQGVQTCIGGSWGTCEGFVKPKVEQCETEADEDCDGNSGCCGDGIVSLGEECDDGDENGIHSCSVECKKRKVLQVVVGRVHACALLPGGKVKCWGYNRNGELGLGDDEDRGDEADEMGDKLPEVDLGANVSAIALAAGAHHTCALLDDGTVKCWGYAKDGALGLGNASHRGDEPDEMGDKLPAVDLGVKEPVVAVTGGWHYSCAVLESGLLKCWGFNAYGMLGLGDATNRGAKPGDMGEKLPFVELGKGGESARISTGWYNCALFQSGHVKCWGPNQNGQLGLGDPNHRGDDPDEMGDYLPFVQLGADATVMSLDVGWDHSCALLTDGRVKCWGCNWSGQLGIGSAEKLVGDNPGEMGDSLLSVDLGAGFEPISVNAGADTSCALLKGGLVKCWGYNAYGELGLGDTNNRGDGPGEMGNDLPLVELGEPVAALAHGAPGDMQGGFFQCALLESGAVKCWGGNSYGQLGLGDTQHRGDQPGEMGENLPRVKLFSKEW